MSWYDVKYVHAMEPRWENALQFHVLAEIAKRYNPRFGYAWPALDTIGHRVKRSAERVRVITAELEGLVLLIRLGPDPAVLGSREGRQRFVPIWRVEDGVQQLLRAALEADGTAPRGSQAVEIASAAPVDPPQIQGGSPLNSRGEAPQIQGGFLPSKVRTYWEGTSTSIGTFKVPSGTETATSAAQPRLPALLAHIRQTLVDEILRKRYAHFATLPAHDSNFRALCKAVSDVLADPVLGARLLKGYEATRDGDVVEAARRLCDGRHIDWGKPHHEKLQDALAWVRAKDTILREPDQAREGRPRRRRRR